MWDYEINFSLTERSFDGSSKAPRPSTPSVPEYCFPPQAKDHCVKPCMHQQQALSGGLIPQLVQ